MTAGRKSQSKEAFHASVEGLLERPLGEKVVGIAVDEFRACARQQIAEEKDRAKGCALATSTVAIHSRCEEVEVYGTRGQGPVG